MSSFALGRELTTVADGCDAPDLTERQPPTISWPAGSWSESSALTFGGVPRFVLPEQLPPDVLSVAGRSMVPYAPGWFSVNNVVPVPLAYAWVVTAYGATCPLIWVSASTFAVAV